MIAKLSSLSMLGLLVAAVLAGSVALVGGTVPAEARRGPPVCHNYYDAHMRWCGVRNGRQGCFVGGYRRMCS